MVKVFKTQTQVNGCFFEYTWELDNSTPGYLEITVTVKYDPECLFRTKVCSLLGISEKYLEPSGNLSLTYSQNLD